MTSQAGLDSIGSKDFERRKEEMEDNDNNTKAMTSVLRLFEEHRQVVEDPSRRDWKWRNGTILFPEGKCCYCNAPVRSDKLWVVDQGWLRGQLNIKEGVFEKPDHPHSGTDGGLCLGDSDNPIDALFFGVNPSDPLRRDMSIGEWYSRMFGHVCGSKEAMALKASELFPGNCGGRDDDDEERDDDCDRCCNCCEVECCSESGICDCGCAECYCLRSTCFRCEGPIGEDYTHLDQGDSRWRWICHTCWSETHARCPRCRNVHPSNEFVNAGDASYCQYCTRYMAMVATPVISVTPTTHRVIVSTDGTITVTPVTVETSTS